MNASAAAPVLSASQLSVAYGGNTALSIERLIVGEGEVLGVVGGNGAGKSTLVNALAGWSRGTPKVAGGFSWTASRCPAWRPTSAPAPGCFWCPKASWYSAR
jgi:branched-chain amino acid transport system ATP-binding protein